MIEEGKGGAKNVTTKYKLRENESDGSTVSLLVSVRIIFISTQSCRLSCLIEAPCTSSKFEFTIGNFINASVNQVKGLFV